MKRREFVAWWSGIRHLKIKQQVKAETLRHSEAAMSAAMLPEEALKLWSKHRADYRRITPDQLMRWTGVEEQDKPGVRLFAETYLKQKGCK